MAKTSWVCAGVTAVAIMAALAGGLWFGGGPTTRQGWEAASWAAGITTALGLIVTAIAWALSSTPSTAPSSSKEDKADTVNKINGDVSGDSTIVQGRSVRVEKPSYRGSHNDFRGSTFPGTFINEQHDHSSKPDAGGEAHR